MPKRALKCHVNGSDRPSLRRRRLGKSKPADDPSAVTEFSIAVSRKARARFTAVLSSGRRGWPILRSQRRHSASDSPATTAGRANGSRAPGSISNASASTATRAGSSATASATNGVIAQSPSAEPDQHRVNIKHPVGEARRLPSRIKSHAWCPRRGLLPVDSGRSRTTRRTTGMGKLYRSFTGRLDARSWHGTTEELTRIWWPQGHRRAE